MKNAGIVLLVVGFVFVAWSGWGDAATPASAGANIGAGVALELGTVLGGFGLLLLAGVVLRAGLRHRRPQRR